MLVWPQILVSYLGMVQTLQQGALDLAGFNLTATVLENELVDYYEKADISISS